MAPDTLLFDFGGVLLTSLDNTAVQARRDELARRSGFVDGQQMWQRFYTGPEWEATKTGRMSHEMMWHVLLEPLGYPGEEAQQSFVRQLFQGEGVDASMKELLERLAERHVMGILSNADDRLEWLLEQFDLSRFFQVVVNSHRVGVAKPDPAAYQVALTRLNVPARRVFFIDDQRRNIDAAAKLGIVGHHFTAIPALRKALYEYGFLSDGGDDNFLH